MEELLFKPSSNRLTSALPDQEPAQPQSIGPAPSVISLHRFARSLGVDLFESARGQVASAAGRISRALPFVQERTSLQEPLLDLEKQVCAPTLSVAETLRADYLRHVQRQKHGSMALCGTSMLLNAGHFFVPINSGMSYSLICGATAATIGANMLLRKAGQPYVPKSPYRPLTADEREFLANCGFDREGFAQHLRNYLVGKVVPVDTDCIQDISYEELRMLEESKGTTAQELIEQMAYKVG